MRSNAAPIGPLTRQMLSTSTLTAFIGRGCPWSLDVLFGGRSGVACAPISELISRHRSYPGPSIMFARSDETEAGNLAALPVKPIEGSETLRGWARQSGSRSESEDGRAATQNESGHRCCCVVTDCCAVRSKQVHCRCRCALQREGRAFL